MHSSDKSESSAPQPRLRAVLAMAIALLSLQLGSLGQQNATEDQVKAAYLLNFAKLGEWPHRALPDGPSSFVIGVSGADDDFLDVLRAVAAGKTIGTHPVVVTRVNSEEDAKSCQSFSFARPKKSMLWPTLKAWPNPACF